MPTIMTHMMTAGAAGTLFSGHDRPLRFWVAAVVCAALPDADVIGYHYFHIFSGHLLGHRGFFHSPFFAFVLSPAVVFVLFPKLRVFSRSWFAYVLFFAMVTASHGLLDAFTNGGSGIALLSPFSNERYFFPWTPIEVSPLGIRRFLGPRGLQVMISEIKWVWAPVMGLVCCIQLGKSAFYRITSGRKSRADFPSGV